MSSAARQQIPVLEPDVKADAVTVDTEALVAKIRAEIEKLDREELALRASARDIDTVWNCAAEFFGKDGAGSPGSTSSPDRRSGSGKKGVGSRNGSPEEWLDLDKRKGPILDVTRLRDRLSRGETQEVHFRLPSGESVAAGEE